VAWDGIDGHVCRMKGWIAQSINDVDMRIIHLRPMGSSQQSIWIGRLRWGRGKYFMGSAWYYVLAASVYRSFERPLVIGGMGIALGYFRALLSGCPRYPDRVYRNFLRRFELHSLVIGKRRTVARFNAAARRLSGNRS
jgi:hypothetical protein